VFPIQRVAHKHVDLMEPFPEEAVRNNVFGTQHVAEAAAGAGVGRFVMISTDKAVNPACVYGVAKRVAELLVASWAGRSDTTFLTVRFGNVLGSRGSIVPLFRKQIELGGPVTVTHPEARRYFMTLPEAVRLVLQSGAFGRSGETFALDMGEPVRILDLAANMIRLAGLEPGVDIRIEFIGLRPGDKLSEELLTHGTGVRATRHKKIFATTPDRVDGKGLAKDLEVLKRLCQAPDRAGLVRKLKEITPSYQPSPLWEKAVRAG
jgi:FlaA1/EpsC-like NDP-sugar epimerase